MVANFVLIMIQNFQELNNRNPLDVELMFLQLAKQKPLCSLLH